jgi:hypothetical protein
MSRLLTKILNDPPGQKASLPKLKTTETTEKSVDAHLNLSGRPQIENVDVLPVFVDAHKPSKTTFVDANASTNVKSGRPQINKKQYAETDRHKAELKRVHFRLTEELDQVFRAFRATHSLEIQEFFTLAALHYIELCGRPQIENVGVWASQDDRRLMILYNTSTSIINIYKKYHPQNKWKPTDDKSASRFNDVDLKIIELAILQTQGNAGYKKIHSFKYYITEIEHLLEIGLQPETIDTMLERRRQQWQESKLLK